MVTTPGERNICSLCLLSGAKWKYPLTKLISHNEVLVCTNAQSQLISSVCSDAHLTLYCSVLRSAPSIC